MGSDYSATVFSFPVSFRFRPTVASPVLSSPSGFPFSAFFHAWFPVRFIQLLSTQLSVCFLSRFLASLPQLFHKCLISAFASSFSSAFRIFIRSASDPLLSLCIFLSLFLPSSPYSGYSVLRFPLSPLFFPFFRFVSSAPSGCLVLGFLFVSFRPSRFRSHSCSTGAYLMLSLSVFSSLLPLSFVCFRFRFQLLSFLFLLFLFFPFLPLSGYSGVSFLLSLPGFPLLFHPVSRTSDLILSTQLSVSFLSSFPTSLPQLFHRCLPFAFAFGIFQSTQLSFVRSAFLLTTQLPVSTFPFIRLPLTVVPSVPIYPPSARLFPCLLSALVLSMLHLPFSGFLFCHTAATSVPCPLPFGS